MELQCQSEANEEFCRLLSKYQQNDEDSTLSLREKCPYSEFFWSVFSHIRIQYADKLCMCPQPI